MILRVCAATSGVSGAVLVLIGLGQISKRDPAELDRPKHFDARRILRACLWAILLLPFPASIAAFVGVAFVNVCTTAAYWIYLIIFPSATFLQIVRLMREFDDDKTAALAVTLCLTTALCEVAVAVGWYLNLQSPFVFDVISRAAGVGLLLTTITTIVLLIRAHRTSVAMIARMRPPEPQVAARESDS